MVVFKTNKCCTRENGYVEEIYEVTEKDVKVREKIVVEERKKEAVKINRNTFKVKKTDHN